MPALHSLRAPEDSPTQLTLDLQISDPAALLNEIARRYESPERILMEYVDNALDDAEALYRANADAYPYEVRIEVVVDFHTRFVVVRDNCRGMQKEDLERIVANVAQSKKKGITWVNGRFGFGVHAFRAAAEAIQFRTKHVHGNHIELHLGRDQHRGIRRPWSCPGPFPSATGTGTEVTVGPFEEEWFELVTIDSIKQEIERHFERLLARPNLFITVQELGGLPVRCEPFDYSLIPGVDFQETVYLDLSGRIFPLEVNLKVAGLEVPGRSARFFARGRRINEISEIKSFIRKSGHRTSVWGHPHLLGYIEVGEIVRPVITRDDFQRSRGRTALYESILSLEEKLKGALDRLNEAHSDTSLTRLEDVLRGVLNELAREDRLRLRFELTRGEETGRLVSGGGSEGGTDGGPQGGETEKTGGRQAAGEGGDTGPDPEISGFRTGSAEGGHDIVEDLSRAEGAQRRRSGFNIKFGNFPPDLEGRVKRSDLVDGTIYINKLHPDFQDRMTLTRQGRPKFNDRLAAYLAATISIHYKDQLYERYGRQPERRDQLFDEQVEFICRLETALRRQLPLLEQEMGNGNGQEVSE